MRPARPECEPQHVGVNLKERIMRIKRLITFPAWLAFCAGLAACGSGGSQAPAGPAGASPDTATAAIVQCYRTHGDPGFPDPVYDPGDGRWHFAVSPATAPQNTRQACQHLFPQTAVSPPVPQAQFRELLQLAQCLRAHGVPNWPDPNPDGAFPLPPALQRKTPGWVQASSACQRYIPSGGINAVAAS
jgi:hypothetical protein